MRKPKIVVSECLYGTKCRYDGQGYNDKVIQSLKDYVDIQTVCPELAIGLPIPREPIRIEMNKENEEYRLIDYNSKNDYTNQMTEFSEEFINGLDDIDGFINRLLVKPGLTGWAQVNGGYEMTPEEKLKWDLDYIQSRNLFMDIRIIFMTVKVVLTGDGAR